MSRVYDYANVWVTIYILFILRVTDHCSLSGLTDIYPPTHTDILYILLYSNHRTGTCIHTTTNPLCNILHNSNSTRESLVSNDPVTELLVFQGAPNTKYELTVNFKLTVNYT